MATLFDEIKSRITILENAKNKKQPKKRKKKSNGI